MKKIKISRVLVLGSSGVVGHGVASDLIKNNYFVVGTSNKKKLFSSSKNFLNISNIDFNKKNFISEIDKLIKTYKLQAVINCAALLPIKSTNAYRFQMNRVNNQSVTKILNLSIKNKLFFFINMGGHSIQDKLREKNLPEIQKCYLISKNSIEKKILDKKSITKIISLNIIAPYGHVLEETSVVPKFINQVKKGQNINIFSNGDRKQIFTFSEDVGAACRHIFKKKLSGAISFAGPSVITTKTLAKTIISVFTKKKLSVFFKKNIHDQDGVAVNNYLEEKKNKELIFIKKHSLKKSLLKILHKESLIKIKKI
jgi:nucleoside-diphosphate-sugar epimerase